MINPLAAFIFMICTFGISTISVKVLNHWARQRNILDQPNERSFHSTPTPRIGGLPIWGLGAITLGITLAVWPFNWTWAGYLVGSIALGSVALLDDYQSVSRRLRFGVQLFSASLLLAPSLFFGYLDISLLDTSVPTVLAIGIYFTFVVGMVNAYNFMDGIDGISGLQGIVAASAWLVFAYQLNLPSTILLSIILAVTCAGFLVHNWAPAKIFMGDIGSTFLGYTFASMPILAFAEIAAIRHQNPELPTAEAHLASRIPDLGTLLIFAIITVWPFIADTAFTFTRRLLNRENVFEAHRTHVYQRWAARFPDRTTGHRAVSTTYAAMSAAGMLAFFLLAR